jgi:hypothetical protein
MKREVSIDKASGERYFVPVVQRRIQLRYGMLLPAVVHWKQPAHFVDGILTVHIIFTYTNLITVKELTPRS